MTIALPLTGNGPLYQRLYRAVRTGIESGRLHGGTRLPSTRTLAAELGLSRKVVLMAFERLQAEGFVHGKVGAGTYVTGGRARRAVEGGLRADRSGTTGCSVRHSLWCRRVVGEPEDGQAFPGQRAHRALPYDFRPGRPDPEPVFPTTWHRLVVSHTRARLTARRPQDHDLALRQALTEYLAHMRGVSCTPDQVVVVNSPQQGMDLVARVLVDPGDRVVLESVHDSYVALTFRGLGAEIVPVPLDAHGMRPDCLPDPATGVRLVHVTPSHQRPTGAVLPRERRTALLQWATRAEALVIEDDCAPAFRFESSAIEPLAAMDVGGRVVHLGTLSPAFPPKAPLTYLVLPLGQAAMFRAARGAVDPAPASIEHVAVAGLIQDGHLARYARALQRRYDRRRRTLLAALRAHFGSAVPIQGEHAGLHVLVWLVGVTPAQLPVLHRRAREIGVAVDTVVAGITNAPAAAALLLGYGGIPEDRITAGIARLADVVASVRMGPTAKTVSHAAGGGERESSPPSAKPAVGPTSSLVIGRAH